jgi:hypothetical protein
LPAGIATPVVSGDADLGSNSPQAILGTNGDDILTGDSANNVLMGMRGNDSLDGGLGMTLFSVAKVAILCSEVAVMMPYLATAVLTF